MLFLATTIQYVDRFVISVLAPTLGKDLHWTATDYAHISNWFSIFYAFGYAVAGRFIDRVGTKIGYAWAVGIWSIAAACHFAARSVLTFSMARSLLGLAEGGNFPGATRTTAEWFPRKERALSFGLLNAGSNVGPIVAALVVPWITFRFGWPSAFLLTGSLGFLWVLGWLVMYRMPAEHPKVSPQELGYIRSDPPEPVTSIPWLSLFRFRPTWAAILGMMLTSPFWWFYLIWIPKFLKDTYGVDLTNVGPPLITIYVMAFIGSVGGGWLSSQLIARSVPVGRARKLAMLPAVLCVAPLFLVPQTPDVWKVTWLISLAAAGHQAFSANLYTLVSDTMPKPSVSSVVGLAGMAAGLASIGFTSFVGWLVDSTGKYMLVFQMAPIAYLLALALITVLLPRYDQAMKDMFGEAAQA
jgi:ACS family hexuronate transporter-like MFS transporter